MRAEFVSPCIGEEVEHETEYDQCGHKRITRKELIEGFSVKLCEDFRKHHLRIGKRGVGKEEPAEANDMEGEQNGEKSGEVRDEGGGGRG